jgi:hypothetical protein
MYALASPVSIQGETRSYYDISANLVSYSGLLATGLINSRAPISWLGPMVYRHPIPMDVMCLQSGHLKG